MIFHIVTLHQRSVHDNDNNFSQENFDERGQLYCHGDKRLYITRNCNNRKNYAHIDNKNFHEKRTDIAKLNLSNVIIA